MTERYVQMILWAKDKIAEVLPQLPQLEISDDERRVCVDRLPRLHRLVLLGIHHEALRDENYELSYSQMCNAFFLVFDSLAKDGHK